MSIRLRGHKLRVGDELFVLGMGKTRRGVFKGMNHRMLDVEVEQHGHPHRINVAEQRVKLPSEVHDENDELLLLALQRVADEFLNQ